MPAKIVPTFADKGWPRGQRDGSPSPYSRFFRPSIGSLWFELSVLIELF
jgi:hypothetical protein